MVKYSPKENTYKEMYLINKFEKDVMENSLQNMRNDKTKTNQKVPVSITTSSENDKDAIETPNKKETQSKQGNEPLVSNENDIEGFTPEILTMRNSDHETYSRSKVECYTKGINKLDGKKSLQSH